MLNPTTSPIIRGLSSAWLLTDGLGTNTSRPTQFLVELVAFLDANLPDVTLYPGHLPRQGVSFPAIVLNKIYAESWLILSGPSGTGEVHYQFDSYSTDDFEAYTADQDLRAVLQPFRGFMGSIKVQECNLHDEGSEYQASADASDLGTYRHRSEFTFIFDPN